MGFIHNSSFKISNIFLFLKIFIKYAIAIPLFIFILLGEELFLFMGFPICVEIGPHDYEIDLFV